MTKDNPWDGKPDPDINVIEKIARKCLRVGEKDSCTVVLNNTDKEIKRYIIKTNGRKSVMEVWPDGLPIFAQRRAATTRWLQENTTVPVRPAFCSEDGRENELGLGWILEQVEVSRSLGPHGWVLMPWASKKKLAETLATYHAQILDPKNRFKAVGYLFFGIDPALKLDPSKTNVAGEDAEERSYPQNLKPVLSRRSFSTSTELLCYRTDNNISELTEYLSEACDCGGCEEGVKLEFAISVAKRIRAKIAQIFPSEIDTITDTVITFPILEECMLVANRKGEIEEVKQASRASIEPLWCAYQIPEVLLGPERWDVPADGASGYRAGYIEWWKTKLREVYLEKMEILHPGFQQRMKKYQPLTDIAWYLTNAVSYPITEDVENWLNEMEKGNHYSLRSKLFRSARAIVTSD